MKLIPRQLFSITLILLVTFLSRILFLNYFPTGVTNDEVHFILNSKSVFLNFSNLSNNWNPLSFTTIPGEASSELPFILLAPIIGPLPLNLFTARLLHSIIGTALILLIYLISKKLISQKSALIITALASINPWLFYVYRTTFDAPIAIFFLFLSVAIILYLKDKWLYLSIIPITISFYSYIGIKPLIFLTIAATSCYSFRFINNSKNKFHYLLVVLFSLFLTLTYLFNLKQSSSSTRVGELISPWSPEVSEMVRLDRTQTAENLFTPLFSNRFTQYFKFVSSKYLNSFSPNLLFIKGDDTQTGSIWHFGYFYIFDAFFILLGIIFLFIYKKPLFVYLLFLLAISPLPEIIRKDAIPAYVFHSSLQYPILTIISGLGIYYFLKHFKSNIYKFVLLALYLSSFIYFIFIYFFQYPFYASESFSFTSRLLSNLIISESSLNSNHIYVITNEPDTEFKMYLFYSNLVNKETFSSISSAYKDRFKNIINYHNITFTTPENPISPEPSSVIAVKEGVSYSPPTFNNKQILKRLDNSSITYNLYNFTLCNQTPASHSPIELSDFIVTQTAESLCKSHIDEAF